MSALSDRAVPVPARSLYVTGSSMRVRIALWDYSDKYEGSLTATCARRVGDLLDALSRVASSRKATR